MVRRWPLLLTDALSLAIRPKPIGILGGLEGAFLRIRFQRMLLCVLAVG
jgi:hypothetical protein